VIDLVDLICSDKDGKTFLEDKLKEAKEEAKSLYDLYLNAKERYLNAQETVKYYVS
jgi:hypothetical protein